MAEQSKFSGALSKLNKGKEATTETEPDVAVELPIIEKGKVGRPQGKRSDPNFEQSTLLLRKTTKRDAVRQLQDTNSKMDLSDLVEQLLADWIGSEA